MLTTFSLEISLHFLDLHFKDFRIANGLDNLLTQTTLPLGSIRCIGWSLEDWVDHCKELRASYQAIFQNIDLSARKHAEIIHETITRSIELNFFILPRSHRAYPKSLRKISSSPKLIWVRGNIGALSYPMIAIIGSRKADRHTLDLTEQLGEVLPTVGFGIISGGALGIDIAAHRGHIKSSYPIPGIAVLGGGLNKPYPEQNIDKLNELISRGGAWISENPPEYRAEKTDFPARNRIIYGSCMDLIVMRADLRSGTYSTASKAVMEGREVFVLRHPESVQGTHALIEDGAIPFDSIPHLLQRPKFCKIEID